MSVFIENYCKQSQCEFSKKLSELLEEAVIIGVDEINFIDNVPEIIARIWMNHSITCYDVKIIQEVFAGYYWRFTTSIKKSGYELWIDIRDSSELE